MSCFALLDDAGASGAQSRLYTDYVGTLTCTDARDLPAMLGRMQDALAQGMHALALFNYELGAHMHGITPRVDCPPLAQILLFQACRLLTSAEVKQWLEQEGVAGETAAASADVGSLAENDGAAGIADLRSSISEAQFHAALARIRQYLEAGDTYQVNYTYRLRFDAYGSLVNLYRRLRASQPVPYGALIALPDGGGILSFSPELFVRNDGGVLTACPMKGTAPATGNADRDAEQARTLVADAKTRAENLMIVDLLRNDLGRIAQRGTVRVPHLFDVSRFGQVLQMTSTIQARVRDDIDLAQLLAALYPCGSITGAPKRRTMQIIRELEPDARGWYTGAIGWFEAAKEERRIGDFCLSVPIRTLVLQSEQGGVRQGEMGVGAGIVYDSESAKEYAECRLKARFLTGLAHDFELLETMQASASGCLYLERHLQRLGASARYFGFTWHEAALRAQLQQTFASLPPGPHRLRLALRPDGTASIQTAALMPLTQPVKLLLSPQFMWTDDLFLRHKTTRRQVYDAAWKAAEAQGAFDMLFHNEAGEITEGARSNLFIKLRGRWVTPPLSAGLLPGVMRSVLLDDPSWQAVEAPVTLTDLHNAEEIVACNALRGVLQATLVASA
ncbi:para-aminobenzoate synthetase/4-amino-4-deoxychorismate lyase [Paucimonas lemoignei]|uniref:Para-aminobenzoate synthetase/4-amino-4-deoxychorismate lyase n=1 Tax=Paucimonas lemoignei TaxID=29443 RepID=A0A4R3HWZ0_PAULE|nr:bifunctional anthranilate synthase component I family protein/class IV aminotransferase [Paucimonas lemoignei]TCS37816.1 para-aminobenzoate synthetase/4-amino-4-deoxychorismate lyase [Paucimonas lemoignei]